MVGYGMVEEKIMASREHVRGNKEEQVRVDPVSQNFNRPPDIIVVRGRKWSPSVFVNARKNGVPRNTAWYVAFL